MVKEALARAPAPTPGPSPQLLARRLGVRQDGDEICGIATKVPGTDGVDTAIQLLTCGVASACVSNDGHEVEGCCPATDIIDCTLATKCLDSTALQTLPGFSEFGTLPVGTAGCNDQVDQYCAEVRYPNLYSTFVCAPSSAQIYYAVLGSVLPASLSSAPTITSSPVVVIHNPTLPVTVPASSSTSPVPTPTPAPAGSSSPLSTGAIVAIAIAGALVILGALVVFYLLRRSAQKKADTKLQEANVLRQTIEAQRMSQQPSRGGNMNTASWIAAQKVSEPSVTEYHDPSYVGTGIGSDYHNHNGTLYNDDDIHMAPTVDGTVDHNGAPRI